MLFLVPTLPSSPRLSTRQHCGITRARMNTQAMIHSLPQRDVCPYCGQPVTRRQLEAIRARVRAEEQARLKVLEKQLQEQAAAQVRAELAKLSKRESAVAAREQALAQRAKALEAAAKLKFDEGYRKACVEAARVQQSLQKQVDGLKRRLERKTADDLGAVSEEELIERLRRAYPEDVIEPVPRGTNGADVLHHVRERGEPCGCIVYESKNVKTFLSAHVEKARGYRTQYSTPYVVLVTTAFPAGERDFCARDGVLLVHPSKMTYVIDVIRGALIELARASAERTDRETKGGRLLAYVVSDEFKERIRGILDAIDDLRNVQAEERKRHEYVWGTQEEAYRAIEQFAGRIHGRVRAIVEGRG